MKRMSLLNKKKFLFLEKEKIIWLKNLSSRNALRLEEGLLSSSLIRSWRKHFLSDSPVCLKDSLKKKS
jgi:hypothetical protein